MFWVKIRPVLAKLAQKVDTLGYKLTL